MQGIIDHAFEMAEIETGVSGGERELVRGHETLPLMCANGQPTQHILRADDGQHIGLQGPIDGGHRDDATRGQKIGTDAEEGADVGHMFDNFHDENGIELEAFRTQVFGACGTIGDVETFALGMGPGDGDRLFRRIDARHIGPKSGQGLAE